MTPEEIRNEIKKIIDSEKWNKYQLSEYNLAKFQELDAIIEAIKSTRDDAFINSIRTEITEILKKNEYHYSALYLAAVLGYEKEIFLESSFFMQKLINNFQKKEKPHIVEYLCRKILKYNADPFALRALIESLRQQNKHSEIEQLQEKLISLEPSDVDLIIQLAAIKEKNGKIREALRYYQTGLTAFIKARQQKQTEEIWERIISLTPSFFSVLINFEELLLANFNRDFVFHLIQRLSQAYGNRNDLDTLILIQKKLLYLKPDNRDLRNTLIELYTKKYEKNSQCGRFLISSGLKQWWEDVFQAIDRFERFIKFDVGCYVWHQSWGVGRITLIQESTIYVDFEKDSNHKMTFEMALSSLTVIPEDHIKVMKRFNYDKIKKMVEETPVEAVRLFLLSMPNKTATIDSIKLEFTDGILDQDSWNKWWTKTRKELKSDDHFSFLDNKTLQYVERTISIEEELFQKFEDAENFVEKTVVAEQILSLEKPATRDNKPYLAVSEYFQKFLGSSDDVEVLQSYLILSKLKKLKEDISTGIDNFEIKDKLKNDNAVIKTFDSLSVDEKKSFIMLLENYRNDINDLIIKFLETRFTSYHLILLERLEKTSGKEKANEFLYKVIENYKDMPDIFVGFGKILISDNQRFDLYKVYTNYLYLVSILGRKIRNQENEEENKKLQKNIINLIFNRQGPNIINFIVERKKASDILAQKLVDLILDNTYLPEKYKKDVIDEVRKLENIIIA